jgi:hypothetical protein
VRDALDNQNKVNAKYKVTLPANQLILVGMRFRVSGYWADERFAAVTILLIWLSH